MEEKGTRLNATQPTCSCTPPGPSAQKPDWADERGQGSKFSGGWPGEALEDQLPSAAALPLLQNLLVVFNGNALSMVPLENLKSLLAS